MDRKTIIAFILIGGILILWGPYLKWVSPPQQQPVPEETLPQAQQERESTYEDDIAPVEQPEVQPSAPHSLAPADSVTLPREVVIDTDLYRAVLSTQGGTIVSWRLKSFEGINEPWVELLPQNPSGALGLSMNTLEGKFDLSRYVYTCDTDSIVLDETQQTATLVMNLPLQNGVVVQKTFQFQRERYSFSISIYLEGLGALVPTREYELIWKPGLRSTESNVKEDMARTAAYARLGDEVGKYDMGGKDRSLDRREDGATSWVGIRTKYFLMSMIPQENDSRGIGINGRKSSITVGKKSIDLKTFSVALRMPLNAGGSTSHSYEIYLGPQNYSVLQTYGVGLEKCMDMGWTIIRPISRIILAFFVFVHRFVPNYGLVIIIFSILLKVLFYPLTHKQLEATKKMQELQPQIAALKEKYKNDPQRLNKETMALYKQAKANPLGGCFPLLLQMPVFFALFSVFRSTIELRRAEFIFWIKDLSIKDPYFILPIVMAIVMFIQQKMTMKDPKQAAMVYMMPLIMFFFFMNFASGLVLYWTIYNLLSILQQLFVDKRGKLPVK